MTATTTTIRTRIDAALEELHRHRERVVAGDPSAGRSAQVAALYEREAWLWSLLFERTRSRLYWRAALAAEAYARGCAHQWRNRAIAETQLAATSGRVDVPADVTGGMSRGLQRSGAHGRQAERRDLAARCAEADARHEGSTGKTDQAQWRPAWRDQKEA